MQPSSNTKATIEMVIAMILSGTIGYFVIDSGQSFWNVVFFRCLIASITVGAYAYFKGLFPRSLTQKTTLALIVVGGITLVANWVLLFASFIHISFSIATVAYHTQPLMLVIAGAAMAKQKNSFLFNSLATHIFYWLALGYRARDQPDILLIQARKCY